MAGLAQLLWKLLLCRLLHSDVWLNGVELQRQQTFDQREGSWQLYQQLDQRQMGKQRMRWQLLVKLLQEKFWQLPVLVEPQHLSLHLPLQLMDLGMQCLWLELAAAPADASAKMAMHFKAWICNSDSLPPRAFDSKWCLTFIGWIRQH